MLVEFYQPQITLKIGRMWKKTAKSLRNFWPTKRSLSIESETSRQRLFSILHESSHLLFVILRNPNEYRSVLVAIQLIVMIRFNLK